MLISNKFLMQEKRVKPNNVFNLYKHNLYRYVVSSFWHIYGCPMRGEAYVSGTATRRRRAANDTVDDISKICVLCLAASQCA